MALKYKLSPQLTAALANCANALETFIEDQRGERENKSEKWQEGEKAQNHETWLDELETLKDALEDVPEMDE